MLLKIAELKKLLSTITKNRIEKIYIKSNRIQLTINTITKKNRLLPTQKNKINYPEEQKIIKGPATKKVYRINKEQDKYFTIVSPMIGTFYRSPAPSEKPFININDIVSIKQTVCIIEAMKLMNEIESEIDGRIVEILVEDGDIVDCGQALIRIQKQ